MKQHKKNKVFVWYLGEVDVLRGGEVEALLLALMMQESLSKSVGHFHIAAIVLLCV